MSGGGVRMTGCNELYRSSVRFREVLTRVLAGLGLLLLASLLSPPGWAQGNTGRILGSVHDSQDTAIVGAKITITDTLRGATRTLYSDDDGDYVAPDLQP